MSHRAESIPTYTKNEELDNTQKVENMRKAQFLHDVIEEYLRPSLNDFADSPEHQDVIDNDEQYVHNLEKKFDSHELTLDNYAPTIIEALTQFSINQIGLLNDDENGSYSAESIWPTKFDDYANGVDVVSYLHSTNFDFPIAFDVTTKKDDSLIREKILISSNDQTLGYATGLTDIRYCLDSNGNPSWQKRVPRYCVGVDRRTIDNALAGLTIGEDQSAELDTETMALISFKTLYEAKVQNKLFLTPLLDEFQNGYTLSEEDQKTLDQLGTLDGIFDEELQRLIHELPEDIIRTLGPEGDGYSPQQVADLFAKEQGPFGDRVFASIIRNTQKLQEELDESQFKFAHLKEMSLKSIHKKVTLTKGAANADKAYDKASTAFYIDSQTETTKQKQKKDDRARRRVA